MRVKKGGIVRIRELGRAKEGERYM